MGMVPGSTVLSCRERVCLGISGSQWTFGETVGAVLCVGVELSDAVPVNTGAVVWQRILDSDRDGVTPVGVDGRSRQLIIDEKTIAFAIAVWVAGRVGEFKSVGNAFAGGWPLLVKVG